MNTSHFTKVVFLLVIFLSNLFVPPMLQACTPTYDGGAGSGTGPGKGSEESEECYCGGGTGGSGGGPGDGAGGGASYPIVGPPSGGGLGGGGGGAATSSLNAASTTATSATAGGGSSSSGSSEITLYDGSSGESSECCVSVGSGGGPGGGPGSPAMYPMAVAGDPVHLKNGEFRYHHSDLYYVGRSLSVDITFSYGNRREYNGMFGYGWDMSYNVKIKRILNSTGTPSVILRNGKGVKFEYYQDSTDTTKYYKEYDPTNYIEYDPSLDTFKLVRKDKTVLEFDENDNLIAVTDKNGNSITFEYEQDVNGNPLLMPVYGPSEFFLDSDNNGPASGRGLISMEYKLIKITDDLGREIQLTYYDSSSVHFGLLEQISDFNGRTWTYVYDSNNNLTNVLAPEMVTGDGGIQTEFVYGDTNDEHNLTQIINDNEDVVVSNSYDSSDRVDEQTVAGGVYQFDYDTLGDNTVKVIDPVGVVSETTYSTSGQVESYTVYEIDGDGNPLDGNDGRELKSYTTTYEYTDDNRLEQVVYPMGNCVKYIYNSNGYRSAAYAKTDASQPDDGSDDDVIATTYTHDSVFPYKYATVTDPMGNSKSYTYDSYGNVETITYPAITTPNGTESPVVSYTYNQYGQVETQTDPRDIVTKYEYYANDQLASYGKLYKKIRDYGTGEDNLNITTEYTYDSNGRVASVIAPEGNVTEYEYDNYDLTSSVKQYYDYSSGLYYETKLTYNFQGKVTKIERQTDDTSNPWRTTEFTYDALGNVLTKEDHLGNITTYLYDALGRSIKVTDALSREFEYSYDARGNIITYTDPADNEAASTYNDNGKLLTRTDQESNTTTYEYDDFGRRVKAIDAKGHYSVNEYNKNRLITKVVSWDCNGTPSDTTDDTKLKQHRFEYNEMGQTSRAVTMANASSTSAVSTSVDRVTDYVHLYGGGPAYSTTSYYNSGTAAVTTYDYDNLQRVEIVTNPDNSTVKYVYDDNSRTTRIQISSTDPVNSNNIAMTTDRSYDELGRLVEQIAKPQNPDATSDSLWQTTSFVYNSLGNKTQETKPNGVITNFEYDILGRRTRQTVDPTGIAQITEYEYDDISRPTAIIGYSDSTDTTNTKQETTYTYDDLGNVDVITYPDGATIDYDYNNAGKVTSRTDQRGLITAYQYDDNYNLTQKQVTQDSVVYTESFTYDGLNRMLSADKQAGSTYISQADFTYDDMSNLTQQIDQFASYASKTTSYTYDQAGARTSTIYPDGSTTINIISDWQGRIGTISRNSTNLVTYQYNGSLVAQRDYLVPQIAFEPTYDNFGRVTSHITYDYGQSPTVDVTNFGYSYAANENNISQIQFNHRTGVPSNAYSYDDIDRVDGVTYHDAVTEAFNMDDVGNRIGSNTIRDGSSSSSVSYVLDTGTNDDTNRYATIGGSSVSYDAAGNLTLDNNGYLYNYDYENRITEIYEDTNSNGVYDSGTDAYIAMFFYDALGRRMLKVDVIASENTFYYYNDNWQVLEEFDITGAVITAQRYFVYGNYIDEVLMMVDVDSTNSVANGDYYYAHDHLYSATALMDSAGDVVERYEYDAYGDVHITDAGTDSTWFTADDNTYTSSQFGNEYTFTGRRLDTLDSGDFELMYYRNRYYSPQIGRFMQMDSLGIVPEIGMVNVFEQYTDGLNSYEYVSGMPVINYDPYGRFAETAVVLYPPAGVIIIGTVIIAGILYYIVKDDVPPIPYSIPEPVSKCPDERTCDADIYSKLKDAVETACKSGTKMKCYKSDSIATLKWKGAMFKACAMARQNIMNKCFKGIADDGHKEAAENAWEGAKKCAKYINMKKAGTLR